MKMVVERDALIKALHHAQSFIWEGGRTGIETLKNENGDFVRLTFAHDKEEELDAVYAGGKMDIGFNYRYLHDILEKILRTVKISFSENSKPVLLQGQNTKDMFYVLMPMKI